MSSYIIMLDLKTSDTDGNKTLSHQDCESRQELQHEDNLQRRSCPSGLFSQVLGSDLQR